MPFNAFSRFKPNFLRAGIVGLGGLTALSPLAASAEINAGTASQDDSSLEEVIITATRHAGSAFDAPAAVSVVTEKDIQAKGTIRILDALKDLPGVYVRDNAGVPSSYAGQVLMRGVAGYTRNAVLLDGLPLNSSFANGVNWSIVDPDTVERVEVVRGPFSSLYGGTAMGGVVNLITKAPVDKELIVKGGYGSDGLSSGYLSWSRQLGNNIGIRLEGGTRSSDGFRQDLVSKSAASGSGSEASGWREAQTAEGEQAYIVGDKGRRAWWQDNAGASLRWSVSDQSTLTASIRYSDSASKAQDSRSYLIDDTSGDAIRTGTVSVSDDEAVTVKQSDFLSGPNGERIMRYTLGWHQDLGQGAELRVDSYYSDNDYWYVTPTSGEATTTDGTGKYVKIPSYRSGLEASTIIPVGDFQIWTLGLSMSSDRLHKTQQTLANWLDRDGELTTDVTYRANGESQTYAAYAQDQIAIGERLTVYAGARYDQWSTRGAVAQFTGTTFDDHYARRNKGSLSPKLSAVYRPFDDTSIRASIGTAFRSPTLSDMYSTYTSSSGAITYASPSLKPETLTAWELGVEQRLGRGQLSATVFHDELKDMITSMSVANSDNPSISDSERVNIGRARIQGFEVDLRHTLWGPVEGFANYTFSDTEVRSDDSSPDTVGKHLTLIPRQTFNVGSQAQFGNWQAYVAGRYVGKVYSDSDNSDTVNEVYGSYDPFFVVDAKLGWTPVQHVTVALSGFNLLDRRYYQSGLAQGRNLLAELTLRF